MFEYPPKNSISHLEGKETSSTQKCSPHEAAVRLSAAGAAFLRKRPEDQEANSPGNLSSMFGLDRGFSWVAFRGS